MNQTDTVELAIQAGIRFRRNVFYSEYCDGVDVRDLVVFATLVAQYEREALEVELLKLKQGVASKSDYIQGRWDLIGEFQDIIRARGKE